MTDNASPQRSPEVLVRERWRELVDSQPTSPFLRFEGQTWTYAEADLIVRRLAAGLRGRGAGVGTRILLGLSNSWEHQLLHVAVHEIGATLVALVPGLSGDELVFQVNHAEGQVLIVDGEVASALEGRFAEIPSVQHAIVLDTPEVATSDRLRELLAAEPDEVLARLEGYGDTSPALILFTSGSTSKPKGVILPDGAILTSGGGYATRFTLTSSDNFLLPFTLAHGVGGMLALGIALTTGCQITLERSFRPSTFWKVVRDNQVTATLLFPAQMQLLVLTGDGSGAAESPLHTVITHAWNQEFAEKFGIDHGTVWGSTETGGLGGGSGRLASAPEQGFIGLGLADEEVIVVAPDGTRLPANAIGEIVVNHRHVMMGYANDPEASSAALSEIGVRTGDLGELDDQGQLWYRGRLKSMVKRSGENISPEEVESILLTHPFVGHCVVYGVPDPIRTEELAAIVQVTQPIDPAELRAHVASRMARWKAPRYIATVEGEFARLASGKLDRNGMQQLVPLEQYWDWEQTRIASSPTRTPYRVTPEGE
jgi:crotonobetaine/carnitine-CoA ligase